ncbi:hypothetical protein VKT23_011976 [Stygiomarasmius scandens]|uniref:Autophagy-related protein 27 n=1 Tax=Marasmiellus scandens TaxID=2682957 RepID=A0ABR1J7H6_9AGAR
MKTRLFLLISLCLSVFSLAATLEEKPCTVHDENGKFYDLSRLSASKGYEFTSPSGNKMFINVCKPVESELWVLNDKDTASVIRKAHGDFSIGKANTTLVKKPNSVQLFMGEGSPCVDEEGKEQSYRASTVVSFICDTKVFEAGKPEVVAQQPQGDEEACLWNMEWKTHYACPTGERGGPWGFFTILVVFFLILLALYTTLGTLYNRYVLHLRGFDQVPQFSLEGIRYHTLEVWDFARDFIREEGVSGVLEKIKEGVLGLVGFLAGLVSRSGGGAYSGGYSRVPAGPDGLGARTEAGLGGGSGPGGFRRPNPPKHTPSRGGQSAPNSFSHQAGVDVGSGGGERGTPAPAAASQGGQAARGGIGGVETNPVSHFSQTQVQGQGQGQEQGPPPPPRQEPGQGQDFDLGRELGPIGGARSGAQSANTVKPGTEGSREERTFLIDDEEEEEEDIAIQDNTTAPTPSVTASVQSQDQNTHSSSSGNTDDAARVRGRDLSTEDREGTIRL